MRCYGAGVFFGEVKEVSSEANGLNVRLANAHGDTLHAAVEAVEAKRMKNRPLDERVAEFVKVHPDLKYFIAKFYNRARGEVMVREVEADNVETARKAIQKYYWISDKDILDIIIKDE